MSKSPLKDLQVDAVILWVDGNDESYKSKISPYLENTPSLKKSFNNRYAQINEIEFTVNSILKYASFVNSIFIVTDNQTPKFLKQLSSKNKYAKVKIVDHTLIFHDLETYLPTFNSRTIESCLHRIPELSEHFIYLNDDFFIINPTTKKDFFTDNGFPILRGFWQTFETDKIYKKNKTTKASHKKAQERGAKILGLEKLYRFKHTPHPMRKSTLENFFDTNPKRLEENIKYKFRHKSQFLLVALANHLEIKNKTCQLQKDLQLLYIRSYKKPLFWYQFKLNFTSKNKLFMGLQSLNKSPLNTLNYIVKWLTKRVS